MNYRPKKKKMTRLEKKEYQRQHLANGLAGKGVYIFENTSRGDLWLPKPSIDGSKGPIPPGGQWKGDSYFVELVKNRDAKIVKVLVSPQEQNIMPEKLLVDQPDRVTTQGIVEQVVKSDIPLNEGEPAMDVPNTVLINEDPLQGVEILID
jgi:hypothetical protein